MNSVSSNSTRVAAAVTAMALSLAVHTVKGQSPGTGAVVPELLPPNLRAQMRAMGDRLTKPGKERTIIAGTLTAANGQAVPVAIVTEAGGKARIETQGAVTGSDGAKTWKASGVLSSEETDLIETVVNDNMDHFLAAYGNRQAVRFLGARYRYAGGQSGQPLYCDVYILTDNVSQWNGRPAARKKSYCVNSDTGLVERVLYETGGPRSQQVETALSGWKSFQGELFPTKIVRIAGGAAALSIAVTNVMFTAAAADGTFDARP